MPLWKSGEVPSDKILQVEKRLEVPVFKNTNVIFRKHLSTLQKWAWLENVTALSLAVSRVIKMLNGRVLKASLPTFRPRSVTATAHADDLCVSHTEKHDLFPNNLPNTENTYAFKMSSKQTNRVLTHVWKKPRDII